jgi:UDPglucose--hexose-1-phosphate uridylyltransferase
VDGPGGWLARAFPNRFPILEGAHEVIVLSPRHCDSLALVSPAQAADVLRLTVERVGAQMSGGRRYVQFFVNHQPAAGSSLDHPHAQLVALDAVPPAVTRELGVLHRDDCVLCAAIAGECQNGAPRAVLARGELVAWCPAWSSAPYELLVAPRAHGSPFEDLVSLAEALVGLLGSLDRAAGDPPYNLVAHTAPPGVTDFHWHLHVRPKLSEPGGFELGTGITVVELAPEAAALALREA